MTNNSTVEIYEVMNGRVKVIQELSFNIHNMKASKHANKLSDRSVICLSYNT